MNENRRKLNLRILAGRALMLATLLAVPLPLSAQQQLEEPEEMSMAERCAGLSIFECLEEFEGLRSEQARNLAAKESNEAVEDMNNKMTSSSSDGTASAVADTFAPFLASLGIDGVSESNGNINLDFNPATLAKGAVQVSFGATIREPSVFEPLLAAIPEATRSDKETMLKEGFGDFDSVDIRLKLSLENAGESVRKRYYGRDVKKYQDLLSSALLDLSEKAYGKIDDLEDEFIQRLNDGGISPNKAFPDDPNSDVSKNLEETIGATLKVVAAESVAADARFKAALKMGPFFSLADLVANQPQLSLTATFQERDNAAGPSGQDWNLEYSWSQLNVNSFLRWSRQPGRCTSAKIDLECVGRYFDEHGIAKKDLARTLKLQPRFSLSLEYTDSDAFAFQVPLADDMTLDFASGEHSKWIGSAKLGKVLRLDENDDDQARFDLDVSYEDVSGNAMAMAQILPLDPNTPPMEMMEMPTPSRLVATATYSENLPGNMVASFSAVWANKADFLGDVDNELSANFGIKWSVRKKADD